MKKIIAIGIISIFLLTSFNGIINAGEQNTDNKITTSYSFKSPVISKVNINNTVYDSISIDGAPCDGNPGEPMLPGRGAYILLPPNSKVSNIVVNPGVMVRLGSGYLVEPAGEPVPLSDIENAKVPTPNNEIYSSTDMFPGELYSEIGTYNCRGYTILVLKLNPVQYIPASGELFYYPSLAVNVETAKETKDNSLFRGLQEDNNDVGMKVDNPGMSTKYMQTLGSAPAYLNYDLLIITSEALKSGFEPLKQEHDAQGLKTLICTVEDIYNNYTGSDNQDKIRNFIKYAYETYHIKYVLLGGDNEIVPVRYLYTILNPDTPSDLYYAGLDGDWNSIEKDFTPSDKDISIDDTGVSGYCSGRLTGPVIDTTNYITGGSSMLLNFNDEPGYNGSLVLTFDTPIDIYKLNYFRFSTNGSKRNYFVRGIFYDINNREKQTHAPIHTESMGSWTTFLFFVPDLHFFYKLPELSLISFNYRKVVRIELFSWNEGSLPEEDDFIRVDGIYFSDTSELLYGEPGEDDLYAEVHVGRACVDNLNDVSNFTSKTISYMNTDENDAYIKNVSMVGEFLDFGGPSDWGGNFMDDLIGKCFKHFYTTQGFPKNKFNIDKLYDRDWQENGWPEPQVGSGGWPKELLIDQINNQTVHIINHLGHGNNYHVMKLDEPVIYRNGVIHGECHDVYDMTNDKYFFVYSQACYSGAFDGMSPYTDNFLPYDCIAEYLTVKTEHGAFAGIWNTRYGIGPMMWSYTTDGYSQRYHREFWDAVFGENITVISEANQDSKEDNIWRKNDFMITPYYELTLFGDPALRFKYLDSSLTSAQSQSTPQSTPQSQPSTQPSSQLISKTTTQTTIGSTTLLSKTASK
ncbi:MAG: C25 family cysteine peptidase [Euryarchaeota archaeon]|nr:C25 family cysteine peptidase [Euryarchaeota archaeon]